MTNKRAKQKRKMTLALYWCRPFIYLTKMRDIPVHFLSSNLTSAFALNILKWSCLKMRLVYLWCDISRGGHCPIVREHTCKKIWTDMSLVSFVAKNRQTIFAVPMPMSSKHRTCTKTPRALVESTQQHEFITQQVKHALKVLSAWARVLLDV